MLNIVLTLNFWINIYFCSTGAPQVLRYIVQREVKVDKGEDALIQMVFCSDPSPVKTTWEWGSLQLDAGNGNGRYVAESLSQVS